MSAPPGHTPVRDTPSRPRRATRGEETRLRILDAAEGIFAQKGYEGATLRDISSEVGLSNPSLYNHFESKASLYAAVLERGIGPIMKIVTEAVDQGADSAAAAPEIIRVTMKAFGERPQLALLVQHEALSGGQRLTPMLRGYIAPVFAAGGTLAAPRVIEAGWQEQDTPHLVLTMIQAVLGFFTMASLAQELSGQDLLSKDALARQTELLIEISERLFSPIGSNR